ncbi:hypothetical protein [Sedimentitalea todarodis]|uniref:Uncharacterized protein n=1 Tax=Sedimentitalea todarodis TaxID=1631240 RepID=A0ABU3V7W0_9RHOB|nr:hypothetical protein [Sedimentitalea todarodis]MDU9002261.1 hypothetical protein [Sedimentitalea todarodis]
MNFIRPELRAALWRWREALAGVALMVLGLWWMLGPGGLLGWVGGALVLGGLAQGFVGVQKARFRSGGGGPGVVQVDEGQITYFGPLGGGAVAVADLRSIALHPAGRLAHWVLDQPGQPELQIPVNAEGSEALFDVFAALPGIRTERMLAELQNRSPHPVVIWSRGRLRPEHQRLH